MNTKKALWIDTFSSIHTSRFQSQSDKNTDFAVFWQSTLSKKMAFGAHFFSFFRPLTNIFKSTAIHLESRWPLRKTPIFLWSHLPAQNSGAKRGRTPKGAQSALNSACTYRCWHRFQVFATDWMRHPETLWWNWGIKNNEWFKHIWLYSVVVPVAYTLGFAELGGTFCKVSIFKSWGHSETFLGSVSSVCVEFLANPFYLGWSKFPWNPLKWFRLAGMSSFLETSSGSPQSVLCQDIEAFDSLSSFCFFVNLRYKGVGFSTH